jgi:hypothetical protein
MEMTLVKSLHSTIILVSWLKILSAPVIFYFLFFEFMASKEGKTAYFSPLSFFAFC